MRPTRPATRRRHVKARTCHAPSPTVSAATIHEALCNSKRLPPTSHLQPTISFTPPMVPCHTHSAMSPQLDPALPGQQADEITPSSSQPSSEPSFNSSPPTDDDQCYIAAATSPPDTQIVRAPDSEAERVVKVFKDRKDGVLDPGDHRWHTFQLKEGGYEEVQRILHDHADKSLWGFVQDKIRYDWDAEHNRLTVRMPATTHELLRKGTETEAEKQLEMIANTHSDEAVKTFASGVICHSQSDIKFKRGSPPVPEAMRTPDSHFRHRACRWPAVILEVANSQKWSALAKLADEYILDSRGAVQAVVGLGISYREKTEAGGPKKDAWLSVWRPAVSVGDDGVLELSVTQTIIAQPFRDANGTPSANDGLRLHLSDFAPNCYSGVSKPDPEVTITSTQLCKYLNEAELAEAALENDVGWIPTFPANLKIKRRAETPPEDLRDETERAFQEDEDKVEEKLEERDKDWSQGPSGDTLGGPQPGSSSRPMPVGPSRRNPSRARASSG
ncbi:hypothetical protein BDV95DRAFT_357674 [Massariosphaeria phaeospora]|uniref:Uncharacterized protein n=1 Tax=Massariosphaeria phaeospora TaxID=100035 RepID=A0A7C8M9K7_9PLEO|nr:hypothetical protein BDV95DRAFT_357674 [Massariosphaeria phaeospora]